MTVAAVATAAPLLKCFRNLPLCLPSEKWNEYDTYRAANARADYTNDRPRETNTTNYRRRYLSRGSEHSTDNIPRKDYRIQKRRIIFVDFSFKGLLRPCFPDIRSDRCSGDFT
jgi:hypothetical protein